MKNYPKTFRCASLFLVQTFLLLDAAGTNAGSLSGSGNVPPPYAALSPQIRIDFVPIQKMYDKAVTNGISAERTGLLPDLEEPSPEQMLRQEIEEISREIKRKYSEIIRELKKKIGGEIPMEAVNEKIVDLIMERLRQRLRDAAKDDNAFVKAVVLLVSGEGGSGKTTATGGLIRLLEEKIGADPELKFLLTVKDSIFFRSADHSMKQESLRPSPREGAKELSLREKFDVAGHTQAVLKLIEGKPVFMGRYNDSPMVPGGIPLRGNQLAYLNSHGEISITIGTKAGLEKGPRVTITVIEPGEHRGEHYYRPQLELTVLDEKSELIKSDFLNKMLIASEGSEITVGNTVVRVRLLDEQKASGDDNPTVINISGTDYIIERAIMKDSDEVYLTAWVPEVRFKDKINPEELTDSDKLINFIRTTKDGREQYLFEHTGADGRKQKTSELTLGTLNLKAQVCAENPDFVILSMNDSSAVIHKNKWAKERLVAGKKQIPILPEQQMLTPVPEAIFPGMTVLVVEGVTAAAADVLNALAITYAIRAKFIFRLWRIINREIERGRLNAQDMERIIFLVNRRFNMQWTEEKEIKEWLEKCEFNATSLSLAEMLIEHYLENTLDDIAWLLQNTLGMNITESSLKETLSRNSKNAIQILIENYFEEFEGDNLEEFKGGEEWYSYEFYPWGKERRQGSIIMALPKDKGYFKNNFIRLYWVIKERAGGIAVPCMLSDPVSVSIPLGMEAAAAYELYNQQVVIKNSCKTGFEHALEEYYRGFKKHKELAELYNREGNSEKAAEEWQTAGAIQRQAQNELIDFYKKIMDLSRVGITFKNPKLSDWGHDSAQGEQGEQRLILYHFNQVRDDSKYYNPKKYAWEKIVTSKELKGWTALGNWYNEHIFAELPDQETFKTEHFKPKGWKDYCRRVSDPFDYRILDNDMKNANLLLRDAKRNLYFRLYLERKQGDSRMNAVKKQFLVWLDLYRAFLFEHGKKDLAELAQWMFEQIVKAADDSEALNLIDEFSRGDFEKRLADWNNDPQNQERKLTVPRKISMFLTEVRFYRSRRLHIDDALVPTSSSVEGKDAAAVRAIEQAI